MAELWTPGGSFDVPTDGQLSEQEKLSRLASFALNRGRAEGPGDDSADRREMKLNRRANRGSGISKSGSLYSGQSQMSFATGRPQDPLFYWKQNNLPFDVWKDDELVALRHYMRLIYLTHPVMASAIDIFSRLPLTGLELRCKDESLVEFHTTLFLEDLNYEEYLSDILHEYFLVGEAWPLGQFNETLGVWEDDELINPDDVKVIKSPFLKEPRFEMKLPEALRTILQKREPEWEYRKLVQSYPELLHFATNEAYMPVSNVLLKQIKFKADTFHPRGIPLMMRAMRAITQEEMLNSAQDAIASRLYTPLILARLGASATDLGTTVPWIPTSDDLMNFEEALDAALAADFRVLTHHFALQMDSVFGRETMPDFGPDFDRLVGRQLQAFGMSETMLSGAGEGETYAADAINKDIMSQLLRYAQRLVKRFCKDRMMIVAEAQGHYDYEERGGKKYPILEDVLEVDEETGEQTIVQQPKLLVPDIYLREMDLADEQAFQQLMEALRATGVPISMKTRLTNVPIDLDDEIERTHEEQVNLAVEAEKVRKDTYMQLNLLGLPIPEDLEADFRPSALDAPAPSADMGLPLPSLGMDDPASTAALAPTEQDYMQGDDSQEPSGTPGAPPGAAGAVIMPMPTAPPSRPPESDEQRGSMPKPRRSAKIQPKDAPPADDQIEEGRYRLMSGPRLASARPKLDPDIPFDEQDEQGTGTSRAPDSIQS